MKRVIHNSVSISRFDPTMEERERERRGRDLPADYGRLYSWSTRNCCVLFCFRAAGVSPSLSLLGFAAAFGKRFKEIKGKKKTKKKRRGGGGGQMERAKVKRNEVGTEKEQTVPKYQRPRNDSSTSLLSTPLHRSVHRRRWRSSLCILIYATIDYETRSCENHRKNCSSFSWIRGDWKIIFQNPNFVADCNKFDSTENSNEAL